MDNAIHAMLGRYQIKNSYERELAVREIMQEIALSGLSRAGFFDKAAFYGGSCLRIFHGLNRFSEDLDFALVKKDNTFQLKNFFPRLQKEFLSYGIDVFFESKEKTHDNTIQSAFVKSNTLMLYMALFPESEDAKKVISNQRIKIKFEVDTSNPPGGNTEIRYQMLPAPYDVQIFDEPSLFAGKIHALLCREYKQHVKGRDYYDYLFYTGKGSPVNLIYLENKLKATRKISADSALTPEMVKKMLSDKFNTTDYQSAKEDVANFINDTESLKYWSPSLFISTLSKLQFAEK